MRLLPSRDGTPADEATSRSKRRIRAVEGFHGQHIPHGRAFEPVKLDCPSSTSPSSQLFTLRQATRSPLLVAHTHGGNRGTMRLTAWTQEIKSIISHVKSDSTRVLQVWQCWPLRGYVDQRKTMTQELTFLLEVCSSSERLCYNCESPIRDTSSDNADCIL